MGAPLRMYSCASFRIWFGGEALGISQLSSFHKSKLATFGTDVVNSVQSNPSTSQLCQVKVVNSAMSNPSISGVKVAKNPSAFGEGGVTS